MVRAVYPNWVERAIIASLRGSDRHVLADSDACGPDPAIVGDANAEADADSVRDEGPDAALYRGRSDTGVRVPITEAASDGGNRDGDPALPTADSARDAGG